MADETPSTPGDPGAPEIPKTPSTPEAPKNPSTPQTTTTQIPLAVPLEKPRILTLAIKDKAVLYAAYMPFLDEGGLFIPTNRTFKLGAPVTLLLTLLDEPEQITISGKVVWLTPQGAQGNRAAGIGVHFTGENIKETRDKIEMYLAGTLKLERPTYTM